MSDGSDIHAFLAFADELAQDSGLLEQWFEQAPMDESLELVVHPGAWSVDRLLIKFSSVLDAYAPKGARIKVLCGHPSGSEEERLMRLCVGIYGTAKPPDAFVRLPRLGIEDVIALARRQVRNLHVVRVAGGNTLYHRGTGADWGVLRQVFQQDEYGLARLTPWGRIPKPHGTATDGARRLIVDCGANIGASTVYFANAYPTATIVAIEPELENFGLLERNTAPFAGVVALRRAIASEAGELSVVDPGLGEWAYRVGTTRYGYGVEPQASIGIVKAVTIEDVIAITPDVDPFILKVDIEGGEEDLFSAHHATLDRFPVVIVELHDWMFPGARSSRSFLEWHRTYDRDIFTLGENVFSISKRALA